MYYTSYVYVKIYTNLKQINTMEIQCVKNKIK